VEESELSLKNETKKKMRSKESEQIGKEWGEWGVET
jgi:hypothetical protein